MPPIAQSRMNFYEMTLTLNTRRVIFISNSKYPSNNQSQLIKRLNIIKMGFFNSFNAAIKTYEMPVKNTLVLVLRLNFT